MFFLAVLFTSLFFVERAVRAKEKAECEKKDALIKQADDYADSIERTLDAEKEKRANLELQYEQLEKKYNNVKRFGKRAKDYAHLPTGDRVDSLRASSLRAIRR